MIKNILLGYSGARGAQVALSQAVDLARAAKARLHVTTIAPLAAGEGEVELPPAVYIDGPGASRLPEDSAPAGDELPELAATPGLEDVAEICRREEVFCTFHHYHGEPGQRLVQLSRLAELVVVGRRDEPKAAQLRPAGRTARYLAAQAAVPTLFTDREHLPLRSATLFYEPREAGGRALTAAGEIGLLLNITVNVICLPYGEVEAAAAQEEARFALRAYHLDGEFGNATSTLTEALQNAALSWNDPLLILPAPRRQLLFNNQEPVRVALGLPNTNLLLVP